MSRTTPARRSPAACCARCWAPACSSPRARAWRHQRRTIAPALAPRTMPILARHVVAASAAKEAELDRLTQPPAGAVAASAASGAGDRRAVDVLAGDVRLRHRAAAAAGGLRHALRAARRAGPDAAGARAQPGGPRPRHLPHRVAGVSRPPDRGAPRPGPARRRPARRERRGTAARPVRPALRRARPGDRRRLRPRAVARRRSPP